LKGTEKEENFALRITNKEINTKNNYINIIYTKNNTSVAILKRKTSSVDVMKSRLAKLFLSAGI
jgi:hypothetical protein